MTDAIDLCATLDRLNTIGVSLSRERNLDALLEAILLAAKEIAVADAGTIYRVENGRVHFAIMHTDSLNIAMGGISGKPIPDISFPLYFDDGEPNLAHVTSWSVIKQRTLNIADSYSEQGFDFSGTRRFDLQNGYRSQSFLTVPIKNHEHEIIGVLQLINAQDAQTHKVIPFSPQVQQLVESLASQAAICWTNRILLGQLEKLFESFVELINKAIDDKSPYTGGHCKRVPVLSMQLADAANAVNRGPLQNFNLGSQDRAELKVAALLHDCGKVTTPVHVVDKATKLQTIFDRIELIATRFQVLKCEAELSFCKGRIDQEAYIARLAQYDDDLQFLRNVNKGGEEPLLPEHKARILRIGTYPWHPDLSGVEQPFLSDDEIANLCVSRGTLNDEERKIINHHIDITIEMLESLPWPKHLARVPEIAGGHHERMDGKGYPRGLTREQMSIQARIIGIADVFEALTAHDRPYKLPKTLSEALEIMDQMAAGGHIDPDLYQVFIEQKVYLDYARQFLAADQIDIS